jgi:hypothetical protein
MGYIVLYHARSVLCEVTVDILLSWSRVLGAGVVFAGDVSLEVLKMLVVWRRNMAQAFLLGYFVV